MPVPVRRAFACLLVLLGAASCASGSLTPAEESCRQRAYDDPAVRDALLRSNSQEQQVRGPALIEMNALLRQKTRDCLAVGGHAPPGGVEPVKPY